MHGISQQRSARHVAVIGAGVVGTTTALALAERGMRVTLIDGEAAPGLGTSFANGAQLSYSYTDALASPGLLSQLPRLLIGADPAFRIRPAFDPDFLRWILAFLANTSRRRFEENTIAGLALAARSQLAMDTLLSRYVIEFDHAMPGKLHLYRSAASLDAARRITKLKAAHGVEQRLIEPDEALVIEPAIAAIAPDLAGALYTPAEAVGDPHRFCDGVLAVLHGMSGFEARFGTQVKQLSAGRPVGIELANDELIAADTVILCAGLGAARLARGIGVRLPIQPMKGYSLTAPPGRAMPRVSITDGANRVVFCRLGDRVRIAGLAELGEWRTEVDPRRFATLVDSARKALPEAADYEAIAHRWAGLRPTTPNSLPVIASIADGVVANAGHGALGWTYAAGAAERVVDLVEQDDLA